MPQRKIYSLTIGSATFLFAMFAAWWFYFCNRYNVLHYHEQTQLFRFNWLYFSPYLARPGGLSEYAGSFLTQFYYYPVAGSVIIAGVVTAVLLLFYNICRSCGNIRLLFFIPFIPAVLLMISFVNIHFDMSSALGILFALAGLRVYITIRLPVRYWAGFVLFTVVYFIAGGNALLLTVLIFIFELSESRSSRNIVYILLLPVWSAALPWLAWQICYTTPVREAYFALTPGNFIFPTIYNNVLWFSFPVLYLFWRLTAARLNQWNQTLVAWKIIVPNSILAIAITAFGVYTGSDNRAEMLNRMDYELQHENWDTVMSLGKAFPGKNRLVSYLTNIALAESGQMPYRMFHYKQVGVAGLFLDWQLTYFSLWYLGEIYYRLGMILEAEHCAFEALASSPKEPNVQTMRRLVSTNIARRDSATAVKYIGFFEHSLAYRGWAQEQRTNLASAMSDSSFHIPGTPVPRRYDNFFMIYEQPDYALLMLLQSNPTHRMAFEYLMACYLLQKDIEGVVWCMNNYFGNFDYPDIPVHYEEALMVYQNLLQAGDEFYAQFPVSRATRDRFDRYFQAYKAVPGSRRNLEQLEKQFGNTYWFYVHFIEPSTLQKKDEKNRY
jgi:tetratricopeptide (TPR) repeat protein